MVSGIAACGVHGLAARIGSIDAQGPSRPRI